MKLREIIAASHVPYRKVVNWVMFGGSQAFWLAFWLPASFYFVRYLAVSIILVGALYVAFWVYRSGYRKQALLMTIGYVALFMISIVILMWAYNDFP